MLRDAEKGEVKAAVARYCHISGKKAISFVISLVSA